MIQLDHRTVQHRSRHIKREESKHTRKHESPQGRRAAAALWLAQRRDARARWRSALESDALLVSGLGGVNSGGGGGASAAAAAAAASVSTRGDSAEDEDEDGHGDPPEAKQLLQVWMQAHTLVLPCSATQRSDDSNA